MDFYTEICIRKRDKYTLEKEILIKYYKLRKAWQKHHKYCGRIA